MMLAGGLVHALRMLPRGISFSFIRLVTSIFIGLVAYPAGFLSVFLEVWVLFAWSQGDAHGVEHGALDLIIGYLTMGGMFFVGAAVTLLILTAAFVFVARYWPRRAFRALASLIGVVSLGSMLASFLHFAVYLHRTPDKIALLNFLGEPLLVFFGFAKGIPLAVLVGEPLFGAIIGHWLYEAAVEWSAESA